MSPGDSTWPVDVARPDRRNGDEDRAWRTDAWSFGSRDRLFVRGKPASSEEGAAERSAAANVAEPPTATPRRKLDAADLDPVTLRRPSFGKRGFAPVYQWEGVVEEVNGTGFRARLIPFEHGQADISRVEYADFTYDDLSDESDLAFVKDGAVFYWTVGKSRNTAGTYTNTSLVRFRRLPPVTPYESREARREADDILSDLGRNGSS